MNNTNNNNNGTNNNTSGSGVAGGKISFSLGKGAASSSSLTGAKKTGLIGSVGGVSSSSSSFSSPSPFSFSSSSSQFVTSSLQTRKAVFVAAAVPERSQSGGGGGGEEEKERNGVKSEGKVNSQQRKRSRWDVNNDNAHGGADVMEKTASASTEMRRNDNNDSLAAMEKFMKRAEEIENSKLQDSKKMYGNKKPREERKHHIGSFIPKEELEEFEKNCR